MFNATMSVVDFLEDSVVTAIRDVQGALETMVYSLTIDPLQRATESILQLINEGLAELMDAPVELILGTAIDGPPAPVPARHYRLRPNEVSSSDDKEIIPEDAGCLTDASVASSFLSGSSSGSPLSGSSSSGLRGRGVR